MNEVTSEGTDQSSLTFIRDTYHDIRLLFRSLSEDQRNLATLEKELPRMLLTLEDLLENKLKEGDLLWFNGTLTSYFVEEHVFFVAQQEAAIRSTQESIDFLQICIGNKEIVMNELLANV